MFCDFDFGFQPHFCNCVLLNPNEIIIIFSLKAFHWIISNLFRMPSDYPVRSGIHSKIAVLTFNIGTLYSSSQRIFELTTQFLSKMLLLNKWLTHQYIHSCHRRRLHGARGARAPHLHLRAQGPVIMLSPPIFCYTKYHFYVLFQQVNATFTRFTRRGVISTFS